MYNVIGDNMRHFCASAFVIDPITKKILLVFHSKFRKWVQPGGHIEGDEFPEETVKREVFEETGVAYEIDRLAYVQENFFKRNDGMLKGLDCHEITFYFYNSCNGGGHF